MRLYLSDVPSPKGDIAAIKFLWQTISRTKTFREMTTNANAPVPMLKSYLGQSAPTAISAAHEQEWRAIMLFLELYVFILRLSDDDDFFSGIYPDIVLDGAPSSRLRSCSLAMADVKSLTGFLKNVAFALYYNATDILSNNNVTSTPVASRLDAYLLSSEPTPSSSASQIASSAKSAVPSWTSAEATKPDFSSLRSIVTTSMKMLYERDSRRPFLPKGHWLMTSKFDMAGFISAVVAEEQGQHELGENEEEDDGDGSENGYFDDWHTPQVFTSTGQRLSRHARIENLRASQQKAQRERMLATIGPKLEILRNMPFVIPFDTRVQIFRQFVHLDKHRRREGDAEGYRTRLMASIMTLQRDNDIGRHRGRIRRGQVFNDAFDQFYELGDGLKDPIQITFVDQFDAEEAGIDGGGVTKEFLTSVTSEAFGTLNGLMLFASNDNGLLYPNPTSLDEVKELMREEGFEENSPEWQEKIAQLLRRYEFLGRIIGKCLYEGILVDISFAGFFLLKWTASGQSGESTYRGNVNDLRDMDESLYRGLLELKNYAGNVKDMDLDFTISDKVSLPERPTRTITRNLIPNGDGSPVTNDNRLLYISYVARHRLAAQPAQQTSAFLRGLRSIIQSSWLSMFNQNELQRLVGGDSSEIDIEDLRRNTVYSGVYEIGDDGEEHETVKLFWRVMRSFTDAQRRDVLKYVTSTPRAPLLGFSQLSPRFSIRDGGNDQERLPSTSTCVNLLKLPRYKNEGTLRSKLLYAISSGAGFDLS
jgi:ubiquitin-protein ligase E3 C